MYKVPVAEAGQYPCGTYSWMKRRDQGRVALVWNEAGEELRREYVRPCRLG